MNNFPFQYEGKTYWYSRSCASVLFVFAKDHNGNWCIAVNKRGKGTPDFQGCWCAPCGYLDFNETTKAAASREAYEEMGLSIKTNQIKFVNVNSSPSMNLQNVTFKFFTVLPNVAESYKFNTDNMETDEVEDTRWIKLVDIYGDKKQGLIPNPGYSYDYWAFNHFDYIKDIFDKYVNIPWWKKLIYNMYQKWFTPIY